MCGKRNNGYNDCITNNSDVHANWAVVPKCNSTCVANNIYQWNYRHLESCGDKHIRNRYNNVHVHAGCWSMWCCYNNGCCDRYAGYPNVHTNWTVVPE